MSRYRLSMAAFIVALGLSGLASAEDALSELQTRFTVDRADYFLSLAERAGDDRELVLGIVYHNLARSKGATYVAKAIKELSAARAGKGPRLALATAYLGSAITLDAGEKSKAGDVMKASLLLDQGFKLMDEAVALDPNSLDLRFLRAENSLEVSASSPFNRLSIARQDILRIGQAEKDLSPEARAAFHLLSAKAYIAEKRLNDGLKELEAAIKAAPQSSPGIEAARVLSRYEE